MKKYKLAVVVGKFQPFHNGHKAVVDQALEIAEQVVVFIGSAQRSNMLDNNKRDSKFPFSFKERKEIISNIYHKEVDSLNLLILPLVDINAGDSHIWGNYVYNTTKFNCERNPDIFVFGDDGERLHWFDDFKIKPEIMYINRKDIEVSGTQIRTILTLDPSEERNKKLFSLVPSSVYDILKKIKI